MGVALHVLRRRTAGDPAARPKERPARVNPLRRVLVRPEMGAVAGAIAVWLFFVIIAGDRGFLTLAGTATYLQVAAELGILAVAVALLMIGGEFDLSVGSTLGACGLIVSVFAVEYGWNIWAAMALAILFALVVGFFNGYLVLRTGLPSFIVTLGTLFIIRGATIGTTRLLTGRTQIGGLGKVPGYDLTHRLFASSVTVGGAAFPVSILWWLAIAALATWVLLRTSFGNWIFGIGGNVQAAHNVGVPVARVRILLFMGTALAACLVAIIQAVTFTGADVLRGEGQEFFAIIAVVIGGTLLTGGYGSAIGAVFGALIFGMVRQGIVFAGVDADWFQVFLGLMLLIAVLINRYVRARAMRA
jgi:simple sugar transport system permease protein